MIYCDGGSQVVSGCKYMNFQDLQFKLHQKPAVDFSICPVGGHNVHGEVERKIKEINRSIETNVHKERISLLQWKTLATIISNSINDLPIGVGSKTQHDDSLDLIPNAYFSGETMTEVQLEICNSLKSHPEFFKTTNESTMNGSNHG